MVALQAVENDDILSWRWYAWAYYDASFDPIIDQDGWRIQQTTSDQKSVVTREGKKMDASLMNSFQHVDIFKRPWVPNMDSWLNSRRVFASRYDIATDIWYS